MIARLTGRTASSIARLAFPAARAKRGPGGHARFVKARHWRRHMVAAAAATPGSAGPPAETACGGARDALAADDRPSASEAVLSQVPRAVLDPTSAADASWRVSEADLDALAPPAGHTQAVCELAAGLGLDFRDRALLRQAFVHASFAFSPPNEQRARVLERSQSHRLANDRLEILGDAVLSMVLSSYLFCNAPHATPATLTLYTHFLRSNDMLAELAVRLGVAPLVLVGQNFRPRRAPSVASAASTRDMYETGMRSIRGNAVEALIGAVHADRGLAVASAFVARHCLPHMLAALRAAGDVNPVASLNTAVLQRFKQPPVWRMAREGVVSTASVFVGGRHVATGRGRNQRQAKRDAAIAALPALARLQPDPADEGGSL